MTDGMRLFSQIGQGGFSGADQLLPLVYDELREFETDDNHTKISGRFFRRGGGSDAPESGGNRRADARDPSLDLRRCDCA
jgi:hypothetical protein